jgi:alginate O-acetyltransferase complex protein AlgI
MYKPYYLLTFLAAGVVVWACPQTWDFTRRLNWKKVVFVLAMLLVALVVLTTQEFNPFIYFIF